MIFSQLQKLVAPTIAMTIFGLAIQSPTQAGLFRNYQQISSRAASCINNHNDYFGVKEIIRQPNTDNQGTVTLEIVDGGEVILEYDYNRSNRTLRFNLVENSSALVSSERVGRELDKTISQCQIQYQN